MHSTAARWSRTSFKGESSQQPKEQTEPDISVDVQLPSRGSAVCEEWRPNRCAGAGSVRHRRQQTQRPRHRQVDRPSPTHRMTVSFETSVLHGMQDGLPAARCEHLAEDAPTVSEPARQAGVLFVLPCVVCSVCTCMCQLQSGSSVEQGDGHRWGDMLSQQGGAVCRGAVPDKILAVQEGQ